MNNMKLKDVVLVYMTEHENCCEHDELIGICLTEMEAKDFINQQAKAYMEHERFDETGIEWSSDGVTILHYTEETHTIGSHIKLYDKKIGFHYKKSCGKLLIEE